MKEKTQKKVIFFFVIFVGLYFTGYYFLSCNEKFITRNYQELSDRPKPGSSDYIEHRQEVYEATYTCYSKDGQTHTLVSLIYPQNAELPKDYYGTIEERATARIKDSADELGIKLNDNFEKDITIAHVYRQN